MSEELIGLERDGAVAVLTLARPAKLNALTRGMVARLGQVADQLDRDETVSVVIITGAGERAFCAGADLAEWGGLDPLAFGRRWVRDGHRCLDRLARLRQPLIAALNGAALGGGLELAACADLRIAEAHARLGLPEARVGIIPGWSGTQRLVRRVGGPLVKRLVLTGEPLDAGEALRVGLVDEVQPSGRGLARARALAATIAANAPVAVELAKALVNLAEGEETAAAVEAIAGALAHGTEDAREGVAAFRRKRPPQFRGR